MFIKQEFYNLPKKIFQNKLIQGQQQKRKRFIKKRKIHKNFITFQYFYQFSMKYTVFILTFLAYAANHACRMCLSFNKPHIRDAFGFTPLQLGILDAIIYVAYGVGAFFRFFLFNTRYLTKIYLISSIWISIFYCSIPFVCIVYQQQLANHVQNGTSIIWYELGVCLGMGCYGFCQLANWQIVLTLISRHWVIKQGLYIGFWTAMSCIGNIIAFFTCNFMMNTLNCRWQLTMIVFAILNIIAALFLYYFHDPQQKLYLSNIKTRSQRQTSLVEQQQEQQVSIKQKPIDFYQYMAYNGKKLIDDYEYRAYILNGICTKALNYSFLLWYPMYLYMEGFQQIKGYITLIFQLASIFGSFIVGVLGSYDKCTFQRFGVPQENNMCLKVGTIILKVRNSLILLFSVGMIFIYLNYFGQLRANIMITIVLGFTIGGIFHVNSAINAMKMAGHTPRNIDMVSNFSTSLSTTFLGFFQLIIGFMINADFDFNVDALSPDLDDSQKFSNYGNFFFVIIILLFLSAFFSFLRSGIPKMMCPGKKQQQKKQNK